jgi:hypothetical protein
VPWTFLSSSFGLGWTRNSSLRLGWLARTHLAHRSIDGTGLVAISVISLRVSHVSRTK